MDNHPETSGSSGGSQPPSSGSVPFAAANVTSPIPPSYSPMNIPLRSMLAAHSAAMLPALPLYSPRGGVQSSASSSSSDEDESSRLFAPQPPFAAGFPAPLTSVSGRRRRSRHPFPVPAPFVLSATAASQDGSLPRPDSTQSSSSSTPIQLRSRSTRSAAKAARGAIASSLGSPYTAVASRKRLAQGNSELASDGKRQRRSQRKKSCLKSPPPSANLESTLPPVTPPKKKAARKDPPGRAKDDDAPEKSLVDHSCCICMTPPEHEELSKISGCEHLFCFQCISKWAERENSCPLCKVRFSKITRLHPSKGQQKTKAVKDRDQQSDFMSGRALEGLLASIASASSIGELERASQLHSVMLSRMISAAAARGARAPGLASLVSHQRARPRTVAVSVQQGFLGNLGGNDDDDDMTHIFGIMTNRRNPSGASAAASFFQTTPQAQPAFSRSYATNSADRNAGSNADNPLEIDDDSDDDEVEVIQVHGIGVARRAT